MRTGFLIGVAALCFLGFWGSDAAACNCSSSCSGARSLCRSMASSDFRGCRLDCRATFPNDAAGRNACISLCSATRDTDYGACASDRAVCDGVCSAAADPQCADSTCRVAYRDCRLAVQAATRLCLDAAGTDSVAIHACVEPGDVMLNIGRAALDDCLTNAMTGLNVCIAGC